MTIRTRNRYIKALFYFFIAAFVVNLVLFLLQIIHRDILSNQFFIAQGFNTGFSFFKSSFWASVSANGFYQVFVIVFCYSLFAGFEKTQSQEVAFLACFLLGCFCESLKIWVPVINTYASFSRLLTFSGNATILSRFLTTLSLFFCALFSGAEQRQNLEQNLILVLATSFFITSMLPLNTGIVYPSFQVSHSFLTIVRHVQILINLISLATVYLNNRRDGYKHWNVLGLFLLMSGFFILAGCSSYFWFILGAGALTTGMTIYLNQLHKLSSL